MQVAWWQPQKLLYLQAGDDDPFAKGSGRTGAPVCSWGHQPYHRSGWRTALVVVPGPRMAQTQRHMGWAGETHLWGQGPSYVQAQEEHYYI